MIEIKYYVSGSPNTFYVGSNLVTISKKISDDIEFWEKAIKDCECERQLSNCSKLIQELKELQLEIKNYKDNP